MRHRRRVMGPTGLDWTVKRLLVPQGMRPMSRTDILDAAAPRRTYVDGVAGAVPDAFFAPTGPLPLGALLALVMLPCLPLVLALRYARVLRWTVEARAHPWGRRYPPVVLSYAVRGNRESAEAVGELADALARGQGSPRLVNGEFTAQSSSAYDQAGSRQTFDAIERRMRG